MDGQLRQYYRWRDEFREKLGGRCTECGSTERLEFDHIDPETKEFAIGNKIRNYCREKLESELDKCQLLCYTCHKRKTSNEQRKTVCMNGHPRTPENLWGRRCRQCQTEYKREWRRRRREMGMKVT